MKFATAIPSFSRRKGGAERYIVDLCIWMAKEGHEVHVYAEHWDEEAQGIHLHRVKTLPFPKSLRLLSFAIKATREMKRGDYDVTLGVGNTLEADVIQPHGGVHWAWFWRSLKAYDNPILWTIKLLGRVLSPKQWVSGWIENAPYKKKRFHKIVAISDMVKQDIIRWYDIPENKIEVLYNGVDIERFHPRNRQYREDIRERFGIGDDFVMLFVSNNFRMKGLEHLLKALADIKKEDHPPFKLLILGRDRKGPYLRLIKKTGISSEIIFAGSTKEPEKYYGAADLFIHPAFYDAFSLTVLEALASGLPVITTSSTGASGILNHGKDGLIIKTIKDLEELKMAIRYFFKEDMRHEASHSGRMKAEMHSNKINFIGMDRVLKEFLNTPVAQQGQWSRRSK
ncbi:MAG: glycosyltransferase family 4 protein [Deltaproteobacteria bacterium]|nr:glycosyltransferase family 4 protein [Deltaproteobacteria bacterium]